MAFYIFYITRFSFKLTYFLLTNVFGAPRDGIYRLVYHLSHSTHILSKHIVEHIANLVVEREACCRTWTRVATCSLHCVCFTRPCADSGSCSTTWYVFDNMLRNVFDIVRICIGNIYTYIYILIYIYIYIYLLLIYLFLKKNIYAIFAKHAKYASSCQ